METAQRVERMKQFVKDKYAQKLHENVLLGKKRVTIEFADLVHADMELADDLLDDPIETLKAGDIALDACNSINEVQGIRMRVRGELPGPKQRIMDLRAAHLGKFLSIEGTIETKTSTAVHMARVKFQCKNCENTISMLSINDQVPSPKKCPSCSGSHFRIGPRELVDGYILRLQDLTSNVKYGSSMATLNVICKEDLADVIIEERLVEGLRVRINGVYTDQVVKEKTGEYKSKLITFLEANYIQVCEETYFNIEVTEADKKKILEYSTQSNLIPTIYNKVYTGVYGYDKIKEGLLLQAFGGMSKYDIVPPIRGEIHILLVGDTGTNKTGFIKYNEKFVPKSVTAVGKTVSVVGLTASVIKDELTGTYLLKPGAIPLANNGQIFIDEFDKLKMDDRDCLLEPMESQTIHVSKANIPERVLLARTSFLVTMNPKHSYFNDYELVCEQIDLPTTILNRFDLVYILKKERAVSEEIKQRELEKAKVMMTRSEPETQKELAEYYKFMRKYISYAKQHIHPTIGKDISECYLPSKYVEFMSTNKFDQKSTDLFPITSRHLWIIRRLAEARARIHLRNIVETADIDYAIEKLRDSFKDIATNTQTGQLDIEFINDGVPKHKKDLLEDFHIAWGKCEVNKKVKVEDLMTQMFAAGHREDEVDKMIQKLTFEGMLFEPGRGWLQKI